MSTLRDDEFKTLERGRTHHLVRTYRHPRGLRAGLWLVTGLLLLVTVTQILLIVSHP